MRSEPPPASGSNFGLIERCDARLDALIPRDAVLELLADGIEWAEGPLWNPADDALLFSDIPRNAIYRWHRDTGLSCVMERSGYSGSEPFTGREPGSNGLTFDREGRLVIAQHGDRRVVRRERDGRLTVLADRYDGKRLNSPNDLVYRSNGDLYFTDPAFGLPRTFDDPARELAFQGVYRVTADGAIALLVRDLEAPNGLAFSPDETTLYVSNAHASRPIWMAYPLRSDGTLGDGRQFADAAHWVGDGEGLPDGIKVDVTGHVFTAGPGGVHVFSPDGTRLGRIQTGVPTANLAWGDDGSWLYVAANHWICRIRTTTRGAGVAVSRRP
jgi:gluconolactonase